MAQKHKVKVVAKAAKAKSKTAAFTHPIKAKAGTKSIGAKSIGAKAVASPKKTAAVKAAPAKAKAAAAKKPVKASVSKNPAPVAAKKPVAAVKAKPVAAAAVKAAEVKKPVAGVQRAAAAVSKPAEQKITAPAPAVPSRPAVAAVPATPKEIAEKAAAARNAAINVAPKKPVAVRHGFKMNEFVVYPAHGVGRIVGIEEQEIAGHTLELFVITFDKEKLTIRVPTSRLVGMRKLAEDGVVKRAMETLKGRARVKRTMWSRRAQEYVAKINSGDLISIAEVVRDLYRSEAQPEQSYSERQLYENALERMARELAAVERLDERGAVQRIVEILSKSAKGRRAAADGADEVEGDVKAA